MSTPFPIQNPEALKNKNKRTLFNVLEIKNKHPHSPNITFLVPSLLIQNPEALKNKIKRTLVNVLE